jgi:hypothetical protein
MVCADLDDRYLFVATLNVFGLEWYLTPMCWTQVIHENIVSACEPLSLQPHTGSQGGSGGAIVSPSNPLAATARGGTPDRAGWSERDGRPVGAEDGCGDCCDNGRSLNNPLVRRVDIVDASAKLLAAHTAELAVRRQVARSIGTTANRQQLLLLLAAWLHEPYYSAVTESAELFRAVAIG